jgi:DNA-binding beta-propeller fold protein YncE
MLASGSQLGLTGATTGSGALRDLALTPSGNSVLVSSFAGGAVYKVNITSGAVSTFTTGKLPQGIVFTSAGNLFLNLGSGIEQLNPTTGASINSNLTNGSLDGLTYDPKTGFLYATSSTTGGASILQINPTTLAEKTLTISGNGIPTSLNLDGIETTGNGNLIIANYMNNMLEYYTGTNTTTLLSSTAGIDDVSPLIGGGGSSIAGTPEPGTLVLFGTGILLMSFLMLRSRKNPESC